MKTQNAGPSPRVADSMRSVWGLGLCISNKCPWALDASVQQSCSDGHSLGALRMKERVDIDELVAVPITDGKGP